MEKEKFNISKNNFKLYIKAILELESIFEKYHQKIISKEPIILKETGYLIEKKYLDSIKENLFYSEFKECIDDYIKFEKMMKEKYETIKYISYIPFEQKIFNTSKELEIDIQKNNEYVIINRTVWELMNNGLYKEDEGKILYEIKNYNLIIFFSPTDKISLKYNFNIINKQNLIPKKFLLDTRKNNLIKFFLKENNTKRNIKNIDNFIKLLLNIFSNNRYINAKLNKKLEKEQKFEVGYIINLKYIKELKKNLNYEEFCKNKIIEELIQNFNNGLKELIKNKKFFEELKNDLIKNNFFENINIDKAKIKDMKSDEKLINLKKICLNENGLYYYKNIEIISNDLYECFDEEHLSLGNDYMIKASCLIGEKKVFFYPSFINKTDLIIGNVISDNKIIPELILNCENSTKLIDFIDEILEKGYDNTISNLIFENNEASIFLEFSNDSIGKAFQIKNENNETKISEEMKKEILNIIKLYLFNLDLKKSISSSLDHSGSDNYEKYINKEKCYLVNKKWIMEYRKYYLYDELYNYLEKGEIKEKYQIHLKNNKNYNEENVQKLYDEIKLNANFFKKYYNREIKIIDESLIEIKEVSLGRIDNKEIKYYKDFVLINSDLYRLLIINKYKKRIPENEYLINMGKIIICLNYDTISQILISSLNIMNNECEIIPSAFINFVNKDKMYNHYEKLKHIDFQTFIKQIKE